MIKFNNLNTIIYNFFFNLDAFIKYRFFSILFFFKWYINELIIIKKRKYRNKIGIKSTQ